MKLTPLKFTEKSQSDFLKVLRERVSDYFKNNQLSMKANRAMVIKSIFMIGLYIVPFLLYTFYAPPFALGLALWAIMALGVAGIGMCIMHDANHGAYAENFHLNLYIGKIINWLGGSAFNWKIQHNILHHTYTNIVHYDDDIDDKAILKLSPHAPSKWYHKYQHIYAFLFYAIATLYWCTVKDFIQFFRYQKEGLNKNSRAENLLLFANLLISKILYFGVLFIVPYWVSGIPMKNTAIGFLVMHCIAGLILTIVFQLAHTVDGTLHPIPDKSNIIQQSWAIHQMQTTYNFARTNTFLSWWVGGLNYQVEHHLFPNICHVHYPQLSSIVMQTAKEFGIPYLEFDSLGSAFHAHIRALKKFAY